jgi:4-oxalocrotonate tautomerase
MPVVIVKLGKERTIQQKRKLVKAITEDVVKILGVKPEWVYVLIEELGRENWASAGELHSDKFATEPNRKSGRKKSK